LPHALADAEVRRLFGCITNPIHRTCFAVMYACGLWISEAATLEMATIDGDNRVLRKPREKFLAFRVSASRGGGSYLKRLPGRPRESRRISIWSK
jgi:site-specific recombinase XerD